MSPMVRLFLERYQMKTNPNTLCQAYGVLRLASLSRDLFLMKEGLEHGKEGRNLVYPVLNTELSRRLDSVISSVVVDSRTA